jgi:DNA-binding HxlR family transcriptional regulator
MSGDIREVLCRKWALEILWFLSTEGTQNYSQIEAEFETSSDVITDRLQHLTNVELVHRDEKSTKDVRYSITASGEKLLELMNEADQLLDE